MTWSFRGKEPFTHCLAPTKPQCGNILSPKRANRIRITHDFHRCIKKREGCGEVPTSIVSVIMICSSSCNFPPHLFFATLRCDCYMQPKYLDICIHKVEHDEPSIWTYAFTKWKMMSNKQIHGKCINHCFLCIIQLYVCEWQYLYPHTNLCEHYSMCMTSLCFLRLLCTSKLCRHMSLKRRSRWK